MNEENNQQQSEQISEVATTNENTQPITFENEKAFMSRVQREAKKQVQEFVKALGFEDDAKLKEVIQKQKDFEESQKTEYQKLQEQLQQKEQYISNVNQNLKLNEVKLEIINAGIKQDRIPYALKLLDVNSIEYNDGQINKEDLNKKINDLLTDFPELKSNNVTQKAGQDFSQSKQGELLTMDIIKGMSVEEAERRLPEILKFLEKK